MVLLGGDVGAATAQDVFLDFAGGGFGKFGHEGEALGNFEVGEVFPGEVAEFGLGGGGAGFENDEGVG